MPAGELPAGESALPHLGEKDDRGEGETAAAEAQISAGFPLLPNFWLLMARCGPGMCDSPEPGRIKAARGKVRLTC